MNYKAILLLFTPIFVQSAELPFSFKTGDSIEVAKYEKLKQGSEESYCPVKTEFPEKHVIYLSENYRGLFNLDLKKLSDPKYLERYLEVPNSIYVNDEHYINQYKKTKYYEEGSFIMGKIAKSQEFKHAITNLPESVSVEQFAYKVDGGYACVEYINNQLWKVSLNAKSLSGRFSEVSSAVFNKYKGTSKVAYGIVDCADFYGRYVSSGKKNNECIVKYGQVKRADGASIEYQLSAGDFKKRPFEKLKKVEKIERHKGGYVHYFDMEIFNEVSSENNEKWKSYENKYHQSIFNIYVESLKEFKEQDKYIEQF